MYAKRASHQQRCEAPPVCRLKELNPRPSDYKSDALPTELSRHNILSNQYNYQLEMTRTGIEPVTL